MNVCTSVKILLFKNVFCIGQVHVILHFCFPPITPPMFKVEEWHSYTSKLLTFLNVLIYTFPYLLWIALEI